MAPVIEERRRRREKSGSDVGESEQRSRWAAEGRGERGPGHPRGSCVVRGAVAWRPSGSSSASWRKRSPVRPSERPSGAMDGCQPRTGGMG